jgi:hypothetical protein
MKVYANEHEITDALAQVNDHFSGNVKFKRFDRAGSARTPYFNVTLTVEDSRGPGGRWNYDRSRRVAAACWHVHGRFIDALPEGTKVVALDRTVYPGDEWHDWSVSSSWHPVMISETCECLERGLLWK